MTILFIGDWKSYLSGLPRLRMLRLNVWAYYNGFFLALFSAESSSHMNVHTCVF